MIEAFFDELWVLDWLVGSFLRLDRAVPTSAMNVHTAALNFKI